MTNPTITEFSHQCDARTTRPVMSYAVVHDTAQKRSDCFGAAMIDEQILFSCKSDLDDMKEFLKGCDSPYPDATVSFFPLKQAEEVKNIIKTLANDWFNGTSPVGYAENGTVYFAFRTTKSGMFLLTYDSTDYGSLCEPYDIFEKLGLSSQHVVFNCEEASGSDFFNYLHREDPVMLALVKREGLLDSKCVFDPDATSDDDDE